MNIRALALSLLILSLVALCGGCAYKTQDYGLSRDNVKSLQQSSVSGGKIALGEFSSVPAGKNTLPCRAAGPIETSGKIPFVDYIRDAFQQELDVAGLYDAKSPRVLNARLTDIDSNSITGTWAITMEFQPVDGTPFTVEHTYDFSTSFSASAACTDTASAFAPAVQAFLKTVYADPAFIAYVNRQQ